MFGIDPSFFSSLLQVILIDLVLIGIIAAEALAGPTSTRPCIRLC